MALAVDPALALAARLGLALLFATAAAHKLRDPSAFRAALAGYRLAPEWSHGAAVVALIAAELGVAFLLVASERGAVPAALLLALYSAAIASGLARGLREIDCGCFGPAARQPISAGLIARNLALVSLALAAALPAGARDLTWFDTIAICAAVAAGSLLYASANTLLANAPLLRALRGA